VRSALAAAAMLAAGCARCASPSFAVHPVPPGPAPAPYPVARRLLHFGDFGDDTWQQGSVAKAMAAASAAEPFDLALSVGDNLYECGPDLGASGAACTFEPDGNTVARGYEPPPDDGFRRRFEGPMEKVRRDGKPVPVWLVLGNHDVRSTDVCSSGDAEVVARAKACLEVAHRSPEWSMPGRHWVRDEGPARLIAIDSNLLRRDYGGFSFEDEVAFVRAAAAGCEDRLCFIVAHHPSASAGEHRADATPDYLARVRRIEEAAGWKIAAWLAGHEHQLEHLRAPAGYDVLVSGNTSRGRPQERFEALSVPGSRLVFASTAWGFGVLEVGEGRWSYRFVNDRGEPVHCCDARGRGPCQPVTCPRQEAARPAGPP